MKTVLQYDEETEEFKPKPSILQLCQLEKAPSSPAYDPEDASLSKYKPELTGKEIEMGYALVDLAKYAKHPETSEKLPLSERKDMYIEILVLSKPFEQPPPSQPGSQPAGHAHQQAPSTVNPLQRRRTVTEPESEEDFKLVKEFQAREEGYKQDIQELLAKRAQLREENQAVQAEWHKMQMQGSELQKVDRKIQEIEFSMREKNKEIIDRYSLIINKLEDGPEASLALLDFKD